MPLSFIPPERELLRTLRCVAGLEELLAFDTEGAAVDDVAAVLTHGGRFATRWLSPGRNASQREGARLEGGRVKAPVGIAKAYDAFRSDGWMGMSMPRKVGGSALPWAVQFALCEIWSAGDAAFNQLPALTHGVMVALEQHAPEWMRRGWLPRLVSGEWTGALGMTEPQAGSDLGLLRTRAVPHDDHYLIVGQKVFTSWGDHDGAANVLHLVLARLPGAPAGTAGISLFAVPLLRADVAGVAGDFNHVRVVSLEDKIGLHASATCWMEFGRDGVGAQGWLLGEANRGLACMFSILNITRLATAVQGVGLAERAYQQAIGYARHRIQGKPVTGGAASIPIIGHPDVQRMLLTMRTLIAGARALYLYAAAQLDISAAHSVPAQRAVAKARLELLTPVAKSWCSARSVEVTAMAIQVHGGAGYVAETGVASYLADALVGPIYEGSNGIQALDFGRRKVLRDQGQALRELIVELHGQFRARAEEEPQWAQPFAAVDRYCSLFSTLVDLSNQRWSTQPSTAAAAASDFLDFAGTLIAALLLAREAEPGGRQANAEPLAVMKFFAAQVLPRCDTHAAQVLAAEHVVQAAFLVD